MRIVLIGCGGQLGTALTARFAGRIIPLTSDALDIADARQVRRTLPELRPELVINAAAYNFVDRAEEDSERAYAVNATGPRVLAETCAVLDIPLVHVSTDYVFGGARHRPAPD